MGDYNDPFNRNNPNVQSRTKAQNRANVLQLKLMGQAHPTGLTTNLLKLFEPRPPLEYKPPPEKRKCLPYAGIAQFVSHFAEPGDPEYSPPVIKAETSAERRARIQKLRVEEGVRKAAEEFEKYDPSKDPNATGDPYKTLFVARLSYETTEHRIKREFEAYGPIKRVRLITDKESNKPRGYAFVEYMHTRDMKTAYKQADGRKLDNRRVLVDVERGRTVLEWHPRRLGGGLGTTRAGGEEASQKQSGREQQQIASGHSRSEEPRRDDRQVDRDREKSRDRGKERDREREQERSHDKGRDRDPRDEKNHHHKDRDRNRERERGDREKERDRGRERDHARGRDKERDRGRDHDRERDRDRQHERDRERDRDYDRTSHERDRGYSHDKDTDFSHYESKHEGSRERNIDRDEHAYGQEWYGEPNKHGRKRDHDQFNQSHQGHYNDVPLRGAESEYDRERLSQRGSEYYDNATYGKPHVDDYHQQYGYGDGEPREEGEAVGDDYAYNHSEISRSPEYEK